MQTTVAFLNLKRPDVVFENVHEVGFLQPSFIVLKNKDGQFIGLFHSGEVLSVVQPGHDTALTLKS